MQYIYHWIDIVTISIVFIFSISAFFNGFIKEFLLTGSWIISTLVVYMLSPFISVFIATTISSNPALITVVIVKGLIFTVVLLFLSVFAKKVSKSSKSKIPSSINRNLGFLLGFIKIYCILSLFLNILLKLYYQEKESRDLFDKSYSYKILKQESGPLDLVTNLIVNMLSDSDPDEDQPTISNKNKKDVKDAENEPGYKKKNIKELDLLMQNSELKNENKKVETLDSLIEKINNEN